MREHEVAVGGQGNLAIFFELSLFAREPVGVVFVDGSAVINSHLFGAEVDKHGHDVVAFHAGKSIDTGVVGGDACLCTAPMNRLPKRLGSS